MQFPRPTQLSTPLQPPQTPQAPDFQGTSGTCTSAIANTAVGNGATCDSLRSDRRSFAMTILQTQATSLYEVSGDDATSIGNRQLLPSVDSMKELLQELDVLNNAPKPYAKDGSLLLALANYLPLAEAAMTISTDLQFMQGAFGMDADSAEQASLLSSYHESCLDVAWQICQASLHYAFQAHRLCNLSEDAAAAELKAPLASKQEGNKGTLHELLLERQKFGIQLTGLALVLLSQHQYWSFDLGSKPRVYSSLDNHLLYDSAAAHFRRLRDLEIHLQTYAVTPERAFVRRVFDAADNNMSRVSSSLERVASDRLSSYEVEAADGACHVSSHWAQRDAMWRDISLDQTHLSLNDIKFRMDALAQDTCLSIDKAIEVFKSQLSYFFESRLNITSCADQQAERGLLESYARLCEYELQREDASTALTGLSYL